MTQLCASLIALRVLDVDLRWTLLQMILMFCRVCANLKLNATSRSK